MRAALRLRRSSDFARVRRSGAVFRHPDLMVSVCRSEATRNRYGIVTSRRLGKAVVRNRCRRRLRSILLGLHDGLRQGFDIVVVARPTIAQQPYGELKRIVCRLLLKAEVWGSC